MRFQFEKVIPDEGHSFKTEEVVGPVVDCVFHAHPEFELTYVESSFGVRFVGDKMATFGENDLVLIGPMLPHHYYNSRSDSVGPDWSRLKVIKFTKEFAGADFFEMSELNDVAAMLDEAAKGLVFDVEVAKKSKAYIDDIFAADGARRVIRLLELLDELAGSNYRQIATNIDIAEATIDDRLSLVLDHIHSRIALNEEVSLSNSAEIARMRPQTFSQYFHRVTRKRFIDYVIELKIGKACGLLSDTDLSVLDICVNSGFNNISNFNRRFRRLKGVTPLEYRQRHRFAK